MMTIEEALKLIDETHLAMRCTAVLASDREEEFKAVVCADLCETLASKIRGDASEAAE